MNKYIIFFLLQCATTLLIGQYVSNVSLPDKNKPVVKDNTDLSYRYAHSIEASSLRDHLRILASDSLEGRETGQLGMELAADYIIKTIRNMGVMRFPACPDYYQSIEFTYSKWLDNDIHVNKERFRYMWDYLAFTGKNESKSLVVANEIVFLGYGIDDPKYSDYKKMDVEDKVIMINRGEPLKKDGKSYITGDTLLSVWSDKDLDKKLLTAKSKGVKLVLIIENDIKKMFEENRSKLLGTQLELGNTKNNIFQYPNHVFISSTIAKSIIGQNEEKILKARKKMEKGKAESVVLPSELIINLTKDVKVLEGKNVIGYMPGKSKKDEYIIVSAHYDHLGKRGDDVFNGADDNGSGSSTLLEMAQACQQAVMEGNRPERSIVFIWFCGEEKGLLGSEYFTNFPVFPLNQTMVNVNVDMVGRIDEKYKDNPDYIYVIGSDRLSSELHKINEDVNQKYTQLTLDYTYNAEEDPNKFYYRSDHYNFAKNGIPIIFYFNGTHPDYHRPTDDIEKINFDTMASRGKLIFHTVWELANRADRIVVDKIIK
ncbi:MAG: M28 family peptidase [Saprospiraceae bacterium]|nr:M28 family peptidase [Saprospiraceae bacterium]